MSDALGELGERIAETAAHLDAAMHRLLTDLREFDAKGGWYAAGAATCGHWLSWRVGWELGTAREHVRVAKALGALPLLDAALQAGELSYCKVRAMTRVATPANERLLLADARLITGEQLEKLCRKYALVQRHESAASRAEDEAQLRWVRRRPMANGMIRIEAMMHPDEAAVVWAALDAVAAAMMTERGGGVPAGTSVAPRPRFDRADALVALAQSYATNADRSATPVEIVVTVPVESLRADATPDPVTVGVLSDGEGIAPEAARRLACDAGIVQLVEDDHGHTLSVGRRTRSIPAAIKRALLHRDGCCRFPGCANRLYVEGHHIEHWADGGETSLSNLVLLCSRHHRFVHEYQYSVNLDDAGDPVFLDPHGRPARDVPSRRTAPDLGWDHLRVGRVLPPRPGWDVRPVPYDEVIRCLAAADAGTLDPGSY